MFYVFMDFFDFNRLDKSEQTTREFSYQSIGIVCTNAREEVAS